MLVFMAVALLIHCTVAMNQFFVFKHQVAIFFEWHTLHTYDQKWLPQMKLNWPPNLIRLKAEWKIVKIHLLQMESINKYARGEACDCI